MIVSFIDRSYIFDNERSYSIYVPNVRRSMVRLYTYECVIGFCGWNKMRHLLDGWFSFFF